MQGRLSPPENGRFQFFPTNWLAEFSQAKTLGFDGICWFLDRDIPDFDPVRDIWANSQALEQIDKVTQILPIRGLDMGRYSFFGKDSATTLEAFQLLLPALAPRLTGQTISIPLLEDKMPRVAREHSETRNNLRRVADLGASLNLRLALETEWPVKLALGFLNELDRPNVGICYDIGNAVSYGFNGPAEILMFKERIFDVHLKDRRIGATQSLLLGTGDADFLGCFTALKTINYAGGFTLQAWRGPDYLEDAKSQLAFVKNTLN